MIYLNKISFLFLGLILTSSMLLADERPENENYDIAKQELKEQYKFLEAQLKDECKAKKRELKYELKLKELELKSNFENNYSSK
jgi:hypothetical protein